MTDMYTKSPDIASPVHTALSYYSRHSCALFPMPAGSKSPTGIVASFARDHSADPAQWARWASENPGCNFGLVAGPSRLIIADIDVKELGRDRAWAVWCQWWQSRSLPVPLPHVESASGGWHVLFRLPDDPPALRQVALIGPTDGSKKAIVDLRVGNGFVVAAGSTFEGKSYSLLSDAPPHPAPDALLTHCERIERTSTAPTPGSRDPADVAALLSWMDERDLFTEHNDWVQAGMALKLEYGDAGFDLWQLTTWPEAQAVAETKWRSFATEPTSQSVTLASLMARAHKAGWRGTVRRTAGSMFGDVEGTAVATAGGMPLMAGQAAVATIGRPLLDRFLATAGSDTAPSDAPQLPEAMRDHPLFQPLNFAINAIIASGRTDAAALDALAVLRAAHESTFDLVRDRVNVGPGDLDAACRRFDARIELEVRTESGWIVHTLSGKPEPSNTANVHKMLRILGCELRRNAWLERDEIRGGPWHDWTHVDDRVVRHILTEGRGPAHNFLPSKDMLWDTLGAFADANEIDPALDALQAMQAAWDGTPRLDTWLHHACNVPDDAYHKAVGRRIIGGMVRRIRHPGCKLDEMAVLIGPQGIRKSELCSALAPLAGSFADGVKLGDESKELILLLAGKAVVEISEMGRRREAEIESVKAMLSKTADIGRTAYARTVRERPRRNIFIGTSNADHPLTDTSGNRRFLPIRVQQIDIEWLRANRDLLIGEAAALEAAGERFDLLPDIWPLAAEHQEAARSATDEELQLIDLFAETPATTCAYVTAADIAQLATDSNWPRGNKVRGATMRRLGFREVRVYVEGKQVRTWYRGPDMLPTNIADKGVRYVIGRHADGRPRVIIRTPGQ